MTDKHSKDSEGEEYIDCRRCGIHIPKSDSCAIGRTFIIFYYCHECYDIIADED